MQTKEHRILEIENEYNVQLTFASEGCMIFFINTSETDLVPFDEDIDMNYILDNFEMVADFSKLQMNIYQIEY